MKPKHGANGIITPCCWESYNSTITPENTSAVSKQTYDPEIPLLFTQKKVIHKSAQKPIHEC